MAQLTDEEKDAEKMAFIIVQLNTLKHKGKFNTSKYQLIYNDVCILIDKINNHIITKSNKP